MFFVFFLFFLRISFIDSEEYCISDVFNPKCPANEIILIKSALYGRKEYGRCLSIEGPFREHMAKNQGYINCYVDATHVVSPKCSGNQECEVLVAKINMDSTCDHLFMRYLEASYDCIKVHSEKSHCSVKVGPERVHLNIDHNKKNSCGSKDRMWNVESMVGQRINISLLQLTWPKDLQACKDCLFMTSGFIGHTFDCGPHAIITDKHKKQQVAVCFGRNQFDVKMQNYVSESNHLEIYFVQKDPEEELNFLFSIESTGCLDIIPPADAYFKRDASGMEATVGCYASRVSWTLKCKNKKWEGVVGNCSQTHHLHQTEFHKLPPKPLPKQNNILIPILSISMGGLVLSSFIICMGVVLLSRYYAQNRTKTLKQINSIYNNSTKLNPTQPPSYQNFGPNPQVSLNVGEDGLLSQESNGHYFELEQASSNNEN